MNTPPPLAIPRCPHSVVACLACIQAERQAEEAANEEWAERRANFPRDVAREHGRRSRLYLVPKE